MTPEQIHDAAQAMADALMPFEPTLMLALAAIGDLASHTVMQFGPEERMIVARKWADLFLGAARDSLT
jgi:hypothetical protein